MNNYVFEFQLIKIVQFCIIPLSYWLNSRLTKKYSFQVFQIFKKSHVLVIRYEVSLRLTA